jgi:MYXO-CTERM domain-containing protein
VLCVASPSARASASFRDSPYLVPVPDYGACDVVVNPANAYTTLAQVNDPSKRVFCIEPGNYRAYGLIQLRRSGTEAQPRFFRFHASDGARNAVERSQRAIFEWIHVQASWWVIQGLTIQPRHPATTWLLAVINGDHNLIDGNLVDAIDHRPESTQHGIVIDGYGGDPATYNTVQRNLVRNGNQGRLDMDYLGIHVRPGFEPGTDNDHNRIIDNEVSDWGDAITVAGHDPNCGELGKQHGTIIDGNDVYVTPAKYVDCDTAAPNPDGECACAENGIGVKSDGGPAPENWTIVTNNRAWGFRPTPNVPCGGSGSNGQAIEAGSQCPGHVLVAGNAVADSNIGISSAGNDWIIAGNLLHDIRATSTWRYGSAAIVMTAILDGADVRFNTIVGVDTAYDDSSANTSTHCNAVIDNLGWMGIGQPRGPNHWTEHNFLYESSTVNWDGATNAAFPSASDSHSETYCYWRKRWSGPEQVCVPLAATTDASPHRIAETECERDFVAPLGVPVVGFTTAPEPDGAALGAIALGAAWFCRRRAPTRP